MTHILIDQTLRFGFGGSQEKGEEVSSTGERHRLTEQIPGFFSDIEQGEIQHRQSLFSSLCLVTDQIGGDHHAEKDVIFLGLARPSHSTTELSEPLAAMASHGERSPVRSALAFLPFPVPLALCLIRN